MQPIRILVVDDHDAVRRGIQSLLADQVEWAICGEAADGIEALEKAKQLRPDIVLMDVSMPRMDGATATQVLRRELPETQVIIVSQNDPSVTQRQATEVGASGFVSKASLAKDLINVLRQVVEQQRSSMPPRTTRETSWLSGGGELGQLIKEHDWSQTPLGEIGSWSPYLRMAVRFLLANRFPQLLWWGPQFCCLYNDAYVPVLGSKHPWALGRPTQEVWHEIWDVLKPLIETPYHGGPATWMEDIQLEINRRGFVEETHFTIAYSPVPDESVATGIGGVMATVHEISEKVVAERRVIVLRDLGARSAEPETAEEACSIAADTLERHAKDVPFALLYLIDEQNKQAKFAAGTGIDPGDQAFPRTISLDASGGEQIWSLAVAGKAEELHVIEDLTGSFKNLPQGPWSSPPTSAAIVPIRSNVAHHLAGFAVLGISSRLQFDEKYRNFFELVATQISITIANARAYAEERKRAEALAEIDRAKTVFFSNVSHEFRTPLTLMLGPLEDMRLHSDELSPAQRDRVDVAHRNSLRLLRLVNTLLDFSRLEARRIEATYEPTNLAQFTAELASVFRSTIERAGLRLVLDCADTEPVYLDREMWEKIVFNLLSNAFKFTFDGEIEVSIRRRDDFAELAVRDTGTGIPPDELPHLFERFHRVRGATGRTFEGSGIGLALVQELAQLHGGSVKVESEMGKGSIFRVSLPFGSAHLPKDRIGARRKSSTAVAGAAYVEEAQQWMRGDKTALASYDVLAVSEKESLQEKRRIVLADDNADMREYVARLLAPEYEVDSFADGEAALEAMRKAPPELVLTDVMMPRMDGYQLLRAVRADHDLKDVPVILLSARAGEESRIEGLDLGADDYLVKPFSARELTARVGSHIAMARMRREAAEVERALRVQADAERSRVRESEERFRAIVETTPECVKLVAQDGSLIHMNSAGLSMIGVQSLESVIGKSVYEMIVPEDRDKFHALHEKVCAGERGTLAFDIIGAQGERRHMETHAVPLHKPDGSTVQLSVTRDVTERRRAEETLHQHHARLDLVAKASQIGFWFCDLPFDKLEWDSRVKEHFWLSPDAEVTIDTFYERLHPDDRERAREAIAYSNQNDAPYDIEYRTVSPDGRVKWIRAIGRTFYDEAKRPKRFDGLTLDVTEQKGAEERERQITAEAMAATAKFRAVFEQTTVFAGIMTKEGVLVDANRLSLDACGYRAEETLGRPFWETGWWSRYPESQEKIKAATPRVADGIPYREVLEYGWGDGTTRLVDFALYPIVDDHGEVFCLHPTGVDITDHKRAEENYRSLAERLEAEVRARTIELENRNADVLRQSELLRDFSRRLLQTQDEERRHIARELHDSAGQTLTVLSMSLMQLVQKAAEHGPELAAEAEQIEEFVQQLQQEIRTTSYLLHPPLLDESGLYSALNWYVQGLVERSTLDIELDIPEGFGRLQRDMELAVFRLVQECLTNIHRHSGSKTATIRIARDAEGVTVAVHDRGRGMPAEKLAEIQAGGSGVGTRGMRERVRQFRGEMKIDSNSAGTSIKFILPMPELSPTSGIKNTQPFQAAV
jgi:PAS domain S-box-containing protein